MKAFLLGVLLLFGVGTAAAANGPDVGDLWWIPSEAGWGMQVVQNRDVLFITLFVYDQAGSPTWFSGTLHPSGLDGATGGPKWSGDIYATRGPWFGAATFDPAQVQVAKVGTLVFTSPTVSTAIVTYSVNGVQVTKNVQRQTLVYEDYGGTFIGNYIMLSSGCTNPANNGLRLVLVNMSITQGASSLAVSGQMVGEQGQFSCEFNGDFTQSGRMSRSATTYACTTGETGSMTFRELTRGAAGFMGRMSGSNSLGCALSGSIAVLD